MSAMHTHGILVRRQHRLDARPERSGLDAGLTAASDAPDPHQCFTAIGPASSAPLARRNGRYRRNPVTLVHRGKGLLSTEAV
jgi:hypothetical protein